MKKASYAVRIGIKTIPIEDLGQIDQTLLNHVDGIEVYLPKGGKILIDYRVSDEVLSISGRELEIMPRASNLIYIKDNGKSFY